MKRYLIYSIFVFSLILAGCSHYDELQKNLIESGSGEDESHNTGKNCGSCHNKNGHEAAGEGRWWTISGSVFYDSLGHSPAKGVTVELWTKPGRQGTMIKKVLSDHKGNFYTNQILQFGSGCYPVIVSGANIRYMGPAFSGGSCNSCHDGVNVKKIYLN